MRLAFGEEVRRLGVLDSLGSRIHHTKRGNWGEGGDDYVHTRYFLIFPPIQPINSLKSPNQFHLFVHKLKVQKRGM